MLRQQNTRKGTNARPGASGTHHGQAEHPAVLDLQRCRDLFSKAADVARGDARHNGGANFDDSLIAAALQLGHGQRRAVLDLLATARDILLETDIKKEILG